MNALIYEGKGRTNFPNSKKNLSPIGNGPYQFKSFSRDQSVVLERDPNWWAADLNVRRGMYNFDRITYKIYKDPTAQLEAFKAGEFDYMQSFVAREWARACHIHNACAYADEAIEIWFARGLQPGARRLDARAGEEQSAHPAADGLDIA